MRNLLCLSLCLFTLLGVSCKGMVKKDYDPKRVVANPIALNYRFQDPETNPRLSFMEGDPSRREAADPVLEYFKGKYYLFASKSGGYWSSPDLCSWTYIKCTTITTMEDYAPTVLVSNDTLYYLASTNKPGDPEIFYTTNADVDGWKQVDSKFIYRNWDPSFFKDDDGKVYLYWGCSEVLPIVGVQVDPNDGFNALSIPDTLIRHNPEKHGWEMSLKKRNLGKNGFNEGPCITKHNGKYYLQYASPGTEFREYADGVYVSDKPLGPYTYEENSPFIIKPGGFIGGAGHGHTFKDKYGNYWHVATMKISMRHMFERRLILAPVFFGDDNRMYSRTAFADYPFMIPDRKVDFEKEDISLGWNLLSYKKALSASSSKAEYKAENASDEQVETWWASETGNAGEWWSIDLGNNSSTINAIQINFADEGFKNRIINSYAFYQYYIEASDDNKTWTRIIDKTKNTSDNPHELVVLDKPTKARYLRITNAKQLEGNFSLFDFRVFGNGGGKAPAESKDIKAERYTEDRRGIKVSWAAQDNVTGYVVNWGVKKDKLYNATMVFSNEYDVKLFNVDSEYFFSIDVFNENGITKGTDVIHVK